MSLPIYNKERNYKTDLAGLSVCFTVQNRYELFLNFSAKIPYRQYHIQNRRGFKCFKQN